MTWLQLLKQDKEHNENVYNIDTVVSYYFLLEFHLTYLQAWSCISWRHALHNIICAMASKEKLLCPSLHPHLTKALHIHLPVPTHALQEHHGYHHKSKSPPDQLQIPSNKLSTVKLPQQCWHMTARLIGQLLTKEGTGSMQRWQSAGCCSIRSEDTNAILSMCGQLYFYTTKHKQHHHAQITLLPGRECEEQGNATLWNHQNQRQRLQYKLEERRMTQRTSRNGDVVQTFAMQFSIRKEESSYHSE